MVKADEVIHNRLFRKDGLHFWVDAGEEQVISEGDYIFLKHDYLRVVDNLARPWQTKDDWLDALGRPNFHWRNDE